MRSKLLCVSAIVMAVTGASFAQQEKGHDGKHPPAVESASVDFGVLPLAPIGPPPCLQTGAIGGPADPCSYQLHHLTPEEVTVVKGGQVTFQVHGGGHGIMIYEVNKDTTREDLGQYLCAGADPATLTAPGAHACNLSVPNANAGHVIKDAKDDVIIVASPNPDNANVHPLNRVWYEPGRLMSIGGQQFLNGGTVPAGAASNGQLVSYRFLKDGRYLVMCMNRVHALNDWMFGFVNVHGND
jgi:hypothetical protein